eukprot:7671-Heterococcus_DN1.PRE.1
MHACASSARRSSALRASAFQGCMQLHPKEKQQSRMQGPQVSATLTGLDSAVPVATSRVRPLAQKVEEEGSPLSTALLQLLMAVAVAIVIVLAAAIVRSHDAAAAPTSADTHTTSTCTPDTP